ncbi:hypothetical protein FPV67DRAFT_424035 [Lyophyllum atratum]|nr:hypothetical protein FPV67DRAFT_424035 [Lyophyllum atratum]
MASLAQVAVHSDSAVVSFSFPKAFDHYPECGTPESVRASTITARLSATLVSVHIFLGPGLGPIDDGALSLILDDIAIGHPLLASFSITSYAESWITRRANLVLRRVPPSIWRAMHVIDPAQNSEALITIHRRGPQVKHVSSAVIPLCRLSEDLITDALCIDIWQLNKLTIVSRLDQAVYHEHRDAILASFSRFLPRARDLRKLSVPLDVSDLAPILFLVAALPHCNELELSSSSLHNQFPQFSAVATLVSGLHQFHHLKKLSLPAEALCQTLHACLGDLEGLQGLKIVATTSIFPQKLPTPRPGQFSMLRTLQMWGSLSHLKWALRAFAHPKSNSLRSVYVESRCLTYKAEMHNTFSIMTRRCPMLKNLGIRIQGINASEGMDWVDLSLLASLHLKDFVIRHPRPLVLSDSNLLRFLVAWRKARHISLNPRPFLLPWVTREGASPPCPTMSSLTHIAERCQALHHLGIHLNSRIVLPHDREDGHQQHQRLRVLDIGGSKRNKESVALISELFPNATLL